MACFKTRIGRAAKAAGPIILACDYQDPAHLKKRAIKDIKRLDGYICGIKINFHLLLPLGQNEIREIIGNARDCNMIAIADIKLNDIGNTNQIAASRLHDMGFDGIIANPIMGQDSLGNLVDRAHADGMGIISLCHMSAPEARASYELDLKTSPSRLYKLFLKWAIRRGADGLIVGATFPDIVRYCSARAKRLLDVYSPGVGVQGGNPRQTLDAGARYIIVGRSITEAADPQDAAKRILESMRNGQENKFLS